MFVMKHATKVTKLGHDPYELSGYKNHVRCSQLAANKNSKIPETPVFQAFRGLERS